MLVYTTTAAADDDDAPSVTTIGFFVCSCRLLLSTAGWRIQLLELQLQQLLLLLVPLLRQQLLLLLVLLLRQHLDLHADRCINFSRGLGSHMPDKTASMTSSWA
jgi:hypothetical protein